MIFSMTKQEIQEDILREYKAGIERDDEIDVLDYGFASSTKRRMDELL